MRVFFDNCTSPTLAATLDGFIRPSGHRAFHIKDVPGLPGGRNATDAAWINHLKNDNFVWIFISGDLRVTKNPAERAALRAAGLHGFVLDQAYQKTPLNEVAAVLLWRWPDILNVTERFGAPSMTLIPMKLSKKPSQLPL